MMEISEVRAWLDTLNPDGYLAIDEGGLTLVVLDSDQRQTDYYCEVGGTPEDDDEEDKE